MNTKAPLLLISLISPNLLFSQINCTSTDNSVPISTNYSIQSQPIPSDDYEKFYIVPIWVRVFRETNGNGGPSNSTVQTAVQTMIDDFHQHNIYVCLGGIDYINDSNFTGWTYLNANGGYTGDEYFLNTPPYSFKKPGYITAYFFDDFTANSGNAFGIVSDHFYVGGNLANNPITNSDHNFSYPDLPLLNTSVTSHELGHCLGLFHTFEDQNDPDFPGNSNCSNDGDLVCDTPPDINMQFQVSDTPDCNFYGNFLDDYEGWVGDTDNLMSYSHPNCLSKLTAGQNARMYGQIEKNPIINTIIEEVTLSGSNVVPAIGNIQLTISSESNLNVQNWNVSPNISIMNTSGNTITLRKNTSCSGKGWVQASFNYGTCNSIVICKSLTIQQNVLAGSKSYNCGSSSPVCNDMETPQCNCGISAFSVSPNPSKSNITIQKNDQENNICWGFDLRSITGQRLFYETNICNKEYSINLSDLKLDKNQHILLLTIDNGSQLEQKRIWIE